MEKDNLISLTKFEEDKDNVNPTEEYILCVPHYEQLKGEYSDFKVNIRVSSIPNVLCEICTPNIY